MSKMAVCSACGPRTVWRSPAEAAGHRSCLLCGGSVRVKVEDAARATPEDAWEPLPACPLCGAVLSVEKDVPEDELCDLSEREWVLSDAFLRMAFEWRDQPTCGYHPLLGG